MEGMNSNLTRSTNQTSLSTSTASTTSTTSTNSIDKNRSEINDIANSTITKTNITKNNALKEYFPSVFHGKIDTVGKVALAAAIFVTAPVTLTVHAVTTAIKSSLAKNENDVLLDEWGLNLNPGEKAPIDLGLKPETMRLINGELKNPTISQLKAANTDLSNTKQTTIKKFEDLAGNLNFNPKKGEYRTDKGCVNLNLSSETLSILNQENKLPTIKELVAAISDIENASMQADDPATIEKELVELSKTWVDRELLGDTVPRTDLKPLTLNYLTKVKGHELSNLSVKNRVLIVNDMKSKAPQMDIVISELKKIIQDPRISDERKIEGYTADLIRNIKEGKDKSDLGIYMKLTAVTGLLEANGNIKDVSKKLSEVNRNELETAKRSLTATMKERFPESIVKYTLSTNKHFIFNQGEVNKVFSSPPKILNASNINDFCKTFKLETSQRMDALRFRSDYVSTNDLKLATPLYQEPLNIENRARVQKLSSNLQEELNFYNGVLQALKTNDENQTKSLHWGAINSIYNIKPGSVNNLGLKGPIPLRYNYPDENDPLMNQCLPDNYPIHMPNLSSPNGEPRIEIKSEDEFKQLIASYSTYFKEVDAVIKSTTSIIRDKTLIQAELKRVLDIKSEEI